MMKQLFNNKGSHALVFCADHNRHIAAAKELNNNFKPQTTGWLITAITDAVLAAQSANIAAQSLEIGALFTTALFRGNFEEKRQLLNLPEKYCFPVISLIFGKAKTSPKNNKGRYAGKGILHKGGYQQMNTTDIQHMINEYDQKDNHFGIPGLAHTQKEKNHLFEKIFGFWGDGGASLSSQQLFESLKNSGYMDAEELNK